MPSYADSGRVGPPDQAYPDADYFACPTRIFKLIQQRRWDDAISHLRQAPEEARRWVVRRYEKEITMRRLPIHEACLRNPTVSVIVALIEANRHGVKEQDLNGRLPLHHACSKGATPDVVQKLVYAYPNSIDAQDKYGKTALDCVKESVNPSERLIKLLQKRPSQFAGMGPEMDTTEDPYRKSRGHDSQRKSKYASEVQSIEEAARHKQMISEATISGLENELTKTNNLLEESNKREQELQKSLDQLREQMEKQKKDLSEELSTERALRNADETAFQEEKQSLKNKAEEVEKEREQKIEEVKLLKMLLEKSQEAASSSQVTLLEEQKKVRELLDKVTRMENEIETERDTASRGADDQQKMINDLEEKLAEFVQLMADAEKSLLEKGKQIKAANTEIESTKESMMLMEAEKQQEIDDLHSNLEELEEVVADLEQKLEETSYEMTSAKESCEVLKNLKVDVSKKSEEISSLETQLQEAKDALSKAEGQANEIAEKSLNEEKEKVRQLNDTVSILEQKLKESQTTIESKESLSTAKEIGLQEIIITQRTQLAQMKDEQTLSEASIAKKEEEIRLLRRENAEVEQKLNEALATVNRRIENETSTKNSVRQIISKLESGKKAESNSIVPYGERIRNHHREKVLSPSVRRLEGVTATRISSPNASRSLQEFDEISELEALSEAFVKEKIDLEAKIEDQNKMLTALEKTRHESEASKRGLENEKASLEAELEKYHKHVNLKEEEALQMQSEIDTLCQTIDDLENRLKYYDNAINLKDKKQRDEMETLKERVYQQKLQLNTFDGEKAKMEAKLKESNSQIRSMQRAFLEERDSLEINLKEAEETIASLEKAKLELEESNSHASTMSRTYLEERDSLKMKLTELEETVASLENAKDELKGKSFEERKDLELQKIDLEKKVESISAKLAECEKEKNNYIRFRSAFMEERDSLQMKLIDFEDKVALLEKAKEELKNKSFDELKEYELQKAAELKEYELQKAALKKELEISATKLTECEKETDLVRSKYDDLRSTMQAFIKNVNPHVL